LQQQQRPTSEARSWRRAAAARRKHGEVAARTDWIRHQLSGAEPPACKPSSSACADASFAAASEREMLNAYKTSK